MKRNSLRLGILLSVCCASWGVSPAQAEPPTFKLSTPLPWEVIQRDGYVPAHAHEHEPGGPALGSGPVPIAGEFPEVPGAVFEFRAVALPGAFGRGTEWQQLAGARSGDQYSAVVKVPAGGWYRIEVRGVADDKTIATAAVEPVGIGEVFVVAGQSYAEGANDELLRIDDPQARVVAFDVLKKSWAVAHDPQPNAGTGGTIWPAMGNTLLPLLRVPIGFVNVAVGGTSSRQWLPGEKLYNGLVAGGKAVGRFRFVLWQQGESDVIEGVPTETYVKNLVRIRGEASQQWGFEPDWLLAKSTLHPTVYNKPGEEAAIRSAIARLWKTPGFRPGPDTDILGGENRGGPNSRRHFSGIGQRRAGLMWFSNVWQELNADGSTVMPARRIPPGAEAP
jgi:hypothetical protein